MKQVSAGIFPTFWIISCDNCEREVPGMREDRAVAKWNEPEPFFSRLLKQEPRP
ncbi:hypothetical protein [Rhodovarius crocodyli]|uniref:hypothetical protein n=1 Tax=Rhodovarius crocodyli TaxID=1979269 RepID=UPI0013E3A90F|nr:hypothetical protein [Rhodovarius crocodyli]